MASQYLCIEQSEIIFFEIHSLSRLGMEKYVLTPSTIMQEQRQGVVVVSGQKLTYRVDGKRFKKDIGKYLH